MSVSNSIFLAYRQKVIEFTLISSANENFVKSREYSFDKWDVSLKETGCYTYKLEIDGSENETKLIKAELLCDRTIELISPYLLLFVKKSIIEDVETLQYLLLQYDFMEKTFTKHSEIPIVFQEVFEICLIDGPLLWVVSNKALFCSQFSAFSVPSISDLIPNWKNGFKLKILYAIRIDIKTLLLFLSRKNAECKEINVVLLSSDKKHSVLKVDQFFPAEFCPIIKTVYCEIYGDNFENMAIVCTKNKHLIVFRNGKLKNCCSIPFHKSLNIFKFHSYTSGEIIFIKSYDHVCCIKLGEKKIFQSWPSVHHILQDDFLGNGNSQMLLLTVLPENSISFTLTDFGWNQFLANQTQVCEEKPAKEKESLQSAINALEVRLKSGLLALETCHDMMQEKNLLLQQTKSSLLHMCQDADNPHTEQGPLLNLLPGNLKQSETDSTQKELTSSIKIVNVQQSIIEKEWIHYFQVKNIGNNLITQISAMILLDKYPITSKSSVVIEHFCVYPNWKDQKQMKISFFDYEKNSLLHPSDIATLVIKATLPICYSDDMFDYQLLVQWSEIEDSSYKDQFSLLTELVIKSKPAIKIKYHLSDVQQFLVRNIVNGKLLIGDENGVYPLDSLERTNFLLKTLHTHLSPNLFKIPHMNFNSQDEYFTFEKESFFQHVRLKFSNISPTEAKIIIFTRDQTECILMLHLLYEYLPDDVIILPYHEDHEEKKKVFIHKLNEEIKSLENLSTVMDNTADEELYKLRHQEFLQAELATDCTFNCLSETYL